MTVEPNQTLLHYRLIEKIGEGGMGVVWKARRPRRQAGVALDPGVNSRYVAGGVRSQRYGAIYDVETGDYRILVGPEDSGINDFMGWLPDGRAVVAEAEKGFIVDFDAGSWTPLPDPPGPFDGDVSTLRTGPDGRFLYYLVTSDEADIWIAEIE